MKRFQSLGRLKRGQMNKTEAEYAAHLELLKSAGAMNKAKNEEQTTGGSMTPPPGSPEAAEQGCTCPVFDNRKGRGCGLTDKDGNPLYYINEKCPLHVAREGEQT